MKAFAIKTPSGIVMIRTLKQFRDECINNYESDLSIAPWKERYKEGYRCVPVEITEPIKIDPDGARLKITKIISQAMTDTMNIC